MSSFNPLVHKKWTNKANGATRNAASDGGTKQTNLANRQLYIADNGSVYRHDRDNGDYIIIAPKDVPVAEKRLSADDRDKRDKLNRLKSLIRMRDLVRNILTLQQRHSDAQIKKEGWTEPPWAADQRRLRELYDSFVHAYGPINIYEIRETGIADEKGQAITFRSYPNLKKFRKDPDAYRVASIEHYNETTGEIQLDPIFETRVVNAEQATPLITDVAQALDYCLSEKGRIDTEYIRELLNTDEPVPALMQRLHEKKRIYFDPEQNNWVLAEDYISGDVRAKLRTAEAKAQQNSFYKANVDILKTVQPAELGPDEIDAGLGQHWLPQETIIQFAHEVLGLDTIEIDYVPETHKWFVNGECRDSYKVFYEMGTELADARRVLEACLNSTRMSVTNSRDALGEEIDTDRQTLLARDKQRRLYERFRQWLWADEERTKHICRIYNDTFNAYVPRSYDGSHMRLPGASSAIALRDFQRNVAWRNIWSGNTLYEHATGAGKTYASITAAGEMKRLGTFDKPLFVVPNHMLNQFARDYYALYPGAHAMIAEADQFLKDGHRMKADEKVQHFISHARNHDYDAIIMTEDNYNRIKLSPRNTLAQKLANLRRYKRGMQQNADERVVGEYQKLYEKKCIEMVYFLGLDRAVAADSSNANDNNTGNSESGEKQRLLDLYARYLETIEDEAADSEAWRPYPDALGQTDKLWFEDMGVDYVFVDEGHVYKNLAMLSRHPGFSRQGSERANAHLAKIDYVRDRNPSFYASIMTATPLSNSIAEAFVFKRYLDPQMLRDKDIHCFDAWLAMFGETREELELMPEGTGYRAVERISRFKNLPELMRMYRAFADVVTEDMLDLEIPGIEGGAPQLITINPGYQAFYDKLDELADRAWRVRNRDVSRDDDNMLKIMNDANNLCLHPGLVGLNIPDHARTKLDEISERVAYRYEEGKDKIFYDAGGDAEPNTGDLQMIVCDLGVPNGNSAYSVYDELRDKLVERGVPAERIRYVHDYESDRKKQELFEACDHGEVSVIIGTTQKVGTGTNVQKRLGALHLATLGWRPMDFIQAIGRILRQGNQHDTVGIYCYAMAESPEAYRWQTNERKARQVNQLKQGDMQVREIEDDPYTEFFAAANTALSQNHLKGEREKTAEEFAKLEHAKEAHNYEKERARYRLKHLKQEIDERQKDMEQDECTVNAMTSPDNDEDRLTLDGTVYEDRAEAGRALQCLVRSMRDRLRERTRETSSPVMTQEIGTIAGFTMHLRGAVTLQEKQGGDDPGNNAGDHNSRDKNANTTREYKYSFAVIVEDGTASEHKLSLDYLRESEAERYLKKLQDENADTSTYSFNSAAEAEEAVRDSAGKLIAPVIEHYTGLQQRLDEARAQMKDLMTDKRNLEAQANKAFPEQQHYDNLRKRLQRLDNKLALPELSPDATNTGGSAKNAPSPA